MISNQKNNPNEIHNELTPLVRTGVHLMSLALKNFSLYPESNSIRIQSLDNLYQWLAKYLEDNESLHLTVEKDRLMFFNDVAYQDKPDEMPLAAPLFRDGIQWFEFQEELTIEELDRFINLLRRFRVLKEEAEDDLATCLWEADLPHIKHKTADEFWEIDPMLEINALKNIIDSSDEPNASDVAAHVEAGSKTVGLVLEAFNRVDKKPKAAQAQYSGDSGVGLVPGQGGQAGPKIDLEQSTSSGGEIKEQSPSQSFDPTATPVAEVGSAPVQSYVDGLPEPAEGVPGPSPYPASDGTEPHIIQSQVAGPIGSGTASGPPGPASAHTGPVGPTGPADGHIGPAGPFSSSGSHIGPAGPSAALDGEETEQEISAQFSELLYSLEHTHAGAQKRKQEIAGALSNSEGFQKVRPTGKLTYIDLSDLASGKSNLRDSGLFEGEIDDGTTTDMAMAEAMFKVSTYFDTQGTSPFWKLTPLEQRHLKSLIAIEEKRNSTGDCLGILKIMLHSMSSQEDRLGVVDFICEEAKFAIGIGDVAFFRAFLDQLNHEARAFAAEKDGQENWLVEFLVELNRKLASTDVLSILAEPLDEKILTEKYLTELRDFLLLLPTEAIMALIPILPKIQNQRLEKVVLGVVAIEACYVKANIAPMVNSLKPTLVVEFINVIKNFKLPLPTALMIGLTRNETPQVRLEAAHILLESNPDNIKQLFHLVDDSNLSINSLICSQMARTRNPVPERILLDYLTEAYNQQNRGHGKSHLLNCYRALGMCASPASIDFLQDILMRKNWKSFLGLEGNWHGTGAAMALMLIPQEWGVREILQKAAQSHFRNIRQAYEQAQQELPLGWKIKDNE